MAYCLACRQNFERSPDGIEHVYNDGTHHSWCNKYTGDLAVTMGGRRPSLHSKPLDFSIAPGRERIMPAHRRSKTKLRRLERQLNVSKGVVLFQIGNVKLMKWGYMYNVYGHWPNGNEIWAERVSLEAAEDFRAMFLRDGASTVVLEPCDMAVWKKGIVMPDVRETQAFALLMKCAGRQFILEALMRNNNCIVHAARELQVNRTHFYKLMRRYGARPLKPARQKRGNAEWRALGS